MQLVDRLPSKEVAVFGILLVPALYWKHGAFSFLCGVVPGVYVAYDTFLPIFVAAFEWFSNRSRRNEYAASAALKLSERDAEIDICKKILGLPTDRNIDLDDEKYFTNAELRILRCETIEQLHSLYKSGDAKVKDVTISCSTRKKFKLTTLDPESLRRSPKQRISFSRKPMRVMRCSLQQKAFYKQVAPSRRPNLTLCNKFCAVSI